MLRKLIVVAVTVGAAYRCCCCSTLLGRVTLCGRKVVEKSKQNWQKWLIKHWENGLRAGSWRRRPFFNDFEVFSATLSCTRASATTISGPMLSYCCWAGLLFSYCCWAVLLLATVVGRGQCCFLLLLLASNTVGSLTFGCSNCPCLQTDRQTDRHATQVAGCNQLGGRSASNAGFSSVTLWLSGGRYVTMPLDGQL